MIPSRDPWQRRAIMLEADLPCVDCSYNLRGLAISSVCPECGRSIWDSLLNRSVPALYSATTSASVMAGLTAGIPLLVAALLALSTARDAIDATLLTLAFTVICFVLSGPGWFALAVEELRPTSGERVAITSVMLLSIAALIASVLLAQYAPASLRSWVGPLWDASLTSVCIYLMLVMSPAARLMFVLRHSTLARLFQSTQIVCLLVAVSCFGSIMLELTTDSGWFRPIAWRSAGIAGVCVLLCMAAAAHRAHSVRADRSWRVGAHARKW
jgi:hypothetical protein